MRHTECRLESIAESMLLADLELETVDSIHNYDKSQQEPAVLPARLPNVLLNGASAEDAVTATNIPPHNLGEIVDALCALIRNPNATVEELMEYVTGPDFPTGGQILGSLGLVDACRTGRGKFTLRGVASIEPVDRKGTCFVIVITELPYQTSKSALVGQIAKMVSNKTLEGVSDIRDESDRSGVKIVVRIKRGVLPQVVLNNLYMHTGLQTEFSCNMVAVSGGLPQTLGLKEFLTTFLDFRCSFIERRSTFLLKRAEDRDHLVQGFLIGLEKMDHFFAVIRAAKDTSGASQALQDELALSSAQAEALLAMPLCRLTSIDKSKVEEEHEALTSEISGIKQLLASRQRILQTIGEEVMQLKHDFGSPRRTKVEQGTDGQKEDVDVMANTETIVSLSERGCIKRMPSDTFAAQNRGSQGKSAQKMKTDDSLSKFVACRMHDYVLFFSGRGVVYTIHAYEIPECSRTAMGSPLVQIVAVPPGERITSVLSVCQFSENQYLVMLTTGGFIKRISLSFLAPIRASGIVAMQLEPGDELRWVRQAAVDDVVVMGSQRGQVLEWTCSKLRPLGRSAKGLQAMKLMEGDKIAGFDIVPAFYYSRTEIREKTDPPWILFITANGVGKRVPVGSFREGGKVGTIGISLQVGDALIGLCLVGETVSCDGESDEQIVSGSQSGIIKRLRVRAVPIQGRKSVRVKVVGLESGDLVKCFSLADDDMDETQAVMDRKGVG